VAASTGRRSSTTLLTRGELQSFFCFLIILFIYFYLLLLLLLFFVDLSIPRSFGRYIATRCGCQEIGGKQPTLFFEHFIYVLQSYLSDEEFENVFHMTRTEFEKIPQWKRENLKRDAYLY
jgi:Villin headpiece domain